MSTTYLLAAVADQLVNSKEGCRSDKEPLEDRRLHKTTTAVQNEQDVHGNVQVMGDPEGAEEIATCVRHGENIQSHANEHQQVAGHTCQKHEQNKITLATVSILTQQQKNSEQHTTGGNSRSDLHKPKKQVST